MTIRDLIFDVPWIFVKSRSILHGGFRTEKGLIRSYINSVDHVLDFGCGTGQYSDLFDADKYVGVDLPGPHLRYAKKWYPAKTFLVFDTNFRVPWRSLSFDWVLCFAVVHHVPPNGVGRFQEEILRVLKPGGRMLIWDPTPVSRQESAWSKFLLTIDRGRFPRLPDSVIDMFRDAVRVEENRLIKAGPYNGYLLVMEKKE